MSRAPAKDYRGELARLVFSLSDHLSYMVVFFIEGLRMFLASGIVVRYCKECGRMSWRIMKVPYAYSFEEYAEFEFLLNEQTQCPYCGGKTRKFRDVSKPIKKIPINKAIYKGEPFFNIDDLPARYR